MKTARLPYTLLGALTATVAAGATAGGLLIRRQRRRGRTEDPQRFDDLQPDRTRTVQSEDGVALHVEEIGPPDAALTVVFAHGFALSARSFYFQRAALVGKFGDDVRLVFYDQRSHGRSGPSVPGSATIEELGRDLYTVLDAVVPTGPVVLVGHSMGGMSVLSLAELHPELFADGRITGVALIATSAGRLSEVTLGLPALINRVRGPLTPLLLRGARRQAFLVEHTRRIGRDLAWVVTRRYSFGSSSVSPDVVDFLNEVIAGTRIETIADFYASLMTFDLTSTLPVLGGADVVVVGAEADLMTPLSHSRRLADEWPDAEYVVAPGAGHAVILEQPDLVDDALVALIARRLDAVNDRAS